MDDKEHMTRKMMDEEYGKSLTAAVVVCLALLALLAIGVAAILLSL